MAATQQDITLKILRDVHDLYVDPSVVNNALGRKGLEDISKEVGFEPSLLPPRKRITVMIIVSLLQPPVVPGRTRAVSSTSLGR